MMRNAIKPSSLFLTLILSPHCVFGATLNVNSDGQLIGASGVSLGSAGLVDLTFVQGVCFDGCDDVSDFELSSDLAGIASQMLLLQVF